MRLRTHRGFTLLELLLVMALLAMATVLVLPRLPSVSAVEQKSGLRTLAYSIRATHEMAAFKKKA